VSVSTWALGRLAVTLLVAALARLLASELGAPLARRRAWLLRELARLGTRTRAEAVLALEAALVLGAIGAAGLGAPLPALGLLASALAPSLWLRRLRRRRRALLERQLEPWLVALTNALAATPALGDALAQSARLVDAPLRDELELVSKEMALGTPLDDALERAAARADSRPFRAVITTLKVARNTGGSLPSTLGAAGESLREMARLEGVVRTKTAEGRVQTIVLGALPAALYGLLLTLRPDHFAPMDHSALGGLLYLGAGLLWVSAVLAAHRILSVDL
jgi:tight adherence protein B